MDYSELASTIGYWYDQSFTLVWQVQMDAEKHITAAANPMSDSGSVDVVLISEQQEGMGAVQDSLRVGAHHVCHCRYATLLPV